MVIPVPLIGTTKLEQMVALQHREVITKHVVMPIPEPAPDLLIVRVDRVEFLAGLAAGPLAAIQLQCAAEAGDLWRSSEARPCPPVPQEAVVNVVGGVSGDVGGQ